MNRGIEKEALSEPELKGKTSRANPIRLDLLVATSIDEQINDISEAMKLEKSATVRMLIWFAMRFAPLVELVKIADAKMFANEGNSKNRLDTRITSDMLGEINSLMKTTKLSKSSAVKTLLFWALNNIGNFTINDWLSKE
jgi:hypothetical protein